MVVAVGARPGAFSSLGSPDYRRFFVGQVISQSGNWMRIPAVSIQVLDITDSGVALGMVTVAQFGPLLDLGPSAAPHESVLCDRLDPPRLLLGLTVAGAAVVAAAATGYLCVLAAAGTNALLQPGTARD